MGLTRIILIRHAQSEANARAVCEGLGDSPLTLEGLADGAVQGRRVRDLFPSATMVSSPLRRARSTAEVIGQIVGLQTTVLHDLREGDVASWEGLPHASLDWNPMRDDPDLALHGGESPRALANRVSQVLRSLAQRHAGQTVIAVSHGAAISHGVAAILGSDPLFGDQYGLPNTGIAELVGHSDEAFTFSLLTEPESLEGVPGSSARRGTA